MQHRHGELGALDPLFNKHLRVIGARCAPGGDQLGDIANLGHTDARSLVRRLDDQRKAQRLGRGLAVDFAGQHRVPRRWQAEALPDLLGAQLVHGQRRGEDAAAGVRNAGTLQQPLHAAVFATAAVQDDKGPVDPLAAQALQQVITGIDTEGIHTRRLQRGEHGSAGLEGDLALGAPAAEEHGDAAEFLGVARRLQSHHLVFLAASSPPNRGLLRSCGASPPISPAPWQSRMSPARSSGLTSGARSTPRST